MTAMSPSSPVCPKSDSYEDVRRTLSLLCSGFSRKYGLDFEELYAEANVAFMDAYNNYIPTRSRFNTYVYNSVNRRLLELVRRSARRSSRFKTTDTDLAAIPISNTPSKLELLWETSPEARFVINSALHPPVDIVLELDKHITPKRLRRGITKFLQDLGWSQARIDKVFEQVGAAIAS